MAGTLDLKTILDPERYNHYCRKDFLEGDPPESAIDYFYKWTSNRYPPNEIISSFEFAKKGAEILLHDLELSRSQTMEIYVIHDTWVAAFMYYWLGIGPPKGWINFMDGFILQLKCDKMNVYTKDSKIEVHYPHWWGLD